MADVEQQTKKKLGYYLVPALCVDRNSSTKRHSIGIWMSSNANGSPEIGPTKMCFSLILIDDR